LAQFLFSYLFKQFIVKALQTQNRDDIRLNAPFCITGKLEIFFKTMIARLNLPRSGLLEPDAGKEGTGQSRAVFERLCLIDSLCLLSGFSLIIAQPLSFNNKTKGSK